MELHIGCLKEMLPDGLVGVSPKCLMGVNVNHGQEIHLRLRTDDLEGWRPYENVRDVLCHELTHQVHDDHNNEFKTLCSKLCREVVELDWTMGRGRRLGGAPSFCPPVFGRGGAPETAFFAATGGTFKLGSASSTANDAPSAAAASTIVYLHSIRSRAPAAETQKSLDKK